MKKKRDHRVGMTSGLENKMQMGSQQDGLDPYCLASRSLMFSPID